MTDIERRIVDAAERHAKAFFGYWTAGNGNEGSWEEAIATATALANVLTERAVTNAAATSATASTPPPATATAAWAHGPVGAQVMDKLYGAALPNLAPRCPVTGIQCGEPRNEGCGDNFCVRQPAPIAPPEVERDAARYRFLRSELAGTDGPVQRELWNEMAYKLCREAKMDREVDEAMRLLHWTPPQEGGNHGAEATRQQSSAPAVRDGAATPACPACSGTGWLLKSYPTQCLVCRPSPDVTITTPGTP